MAVSSRPGRQSNRRRPAPAPGGTAKANSVTGWSGTGAVRWTRTAADLGMAADTNLKVDPAEGTASSCDPPPATWALPGREPVVAGCAHGYHGVGQ